MKRKCSCSCTLVAKLRSYFLLLTLGSGVAWAQTMHTIPAGNGTLSYTETTTYPVCTPNVGPPKTYFKYVYTGFSYTVSGVTKPLSGDDVAYMDVNGVPCPPTSFPPVMFILPGQEILFTPSPLGGGGTANVSGLLYPKYQIASILYAAPGNLSSNGYTNSKTYGTSTSVGSSFQVGDTTTFSESFGFFGIGSTLSWSFGDSTTSGSSTEFSTSISQATSIANDSVAGNPNAINHQEDAFVLWLNPAISLLQTGTTKSVTYAVGTQLQTTGDPSPGASEGVAALDIVAKVLLASSTNGGLTTVPLAKLVPAVLEQNGQSETVPGLASICANPLPASQCTFANQCGCVPSDFTPILNADPLFNLSSTESPMSVNTSSNSACTNPASTAKCRFVPIMELSGGVPTNIQVNVTLQGPDCATCDPTPNSFTETDAGQTTTTLSESSSLTVGFSWTFSWVVAGNGPALQNASQWTWTNMESSGETNSTAHTMAVNLQSNTVGCFDPGVTVYEDTVYHTFAFQQTPGNTSCP